jgi:ATP-dependent exoDNAse (exonuclease V) beta subunit
MTKIKFNKKKHTYKIGDKELMSVTKWCGQFFEEFDAKAVARKLAKFPVNRANKRGVRYWLNQWKESAEHGTRVHKSIERYIQHGVGSMASELDTPKIEAGVDYIDWLRTNFGQELTLEVEKIIYDEELGLAGTVDCVLSHKKHIRIIDWKTNKQISKTGNPKTLCPNIMGDGNLSKYELQLNMYAYMLSRQGYFIESLRVVHLLDDGSYKEYDITFKPELVEGLLEVKNAKCTTCIQD